MTINTTCIIMQDSKAAYTYAIQKYMRYLEIVNPDDLLKYQDNPKFIQNQIIEYLIYLKNEPVSLRYATRSQYLAAIMTYYDLNEVALNKKKVYRIEATLQRKYQRCLR